MMAPRYRVLCFFIFLTLCSWTLSAAGYMYLKPMKLGAGDCIDNDFQKHPMGSKWSDKEKCEEQECIFVKGTLYVRGNGCPKIGHSPECKLVPGEKGADYPDCCQKVECPEVSYDYYDMR